MGVEGSVAQGGFWPSDAAAEEEAGGEGKEGEEG